MNIPKKVSGQPERDERRFLKTLREQTASKHRALDNIVPLMKESVTEASLCEYLKRAAVFHAGFEQHLERHFIGVLNDWNFRLRLPLIRADLQILQREIKSLEYNRFDWSSIDFSSETTLAGWLYVQEGSALGGALIHRHLCQKLDTERMNKLHFFRPNGDNPSDHWKRFQNRLLDIIQRNNTAETQIIAAANHAFDWYRESIE